MLLHTVIFWLKPDLKNEDVKKFERGVRSLLKIHTVKFGYLGKSASTRRPVIDSSYSYKLVVGFDDLRGHDVYQDIDVHRKFIAECGYCWEKVQIYDAIESVA